MQATEVLQIVVLSSGVALVTEAVMWLQDTAGGHSLLPQEWPGLGCQHIQRHPLSKVAL